MKGFVPAPVWVNGLHCCLAVASAVMEDGIASLRWKLDGIVIVDSFSFATSSLSSSRPLAAPHTRQGVALSNVCRVYRPPDGVKRGP